MADNPASTSLPAVENESEALGILFDVLSVLSEQDLTYQVAGQGFTDSLNLAIYQLKGVVKATTASESVSVYPWATVPRSDFVDRIADLAVESIDLILSKGDQA